VRDFQPQGCRGIDETPWTLDRVREWTIGDFIVVYMKFVDPDYFRHEMRAEI
jgi:hypothetical protein